MRSGFTPNALTNSTTAGLKIESRSKMRCRGAESKGKASRSCCITTREYHSRKHECLSAKSRRIGRPLTAPHQVPCDNYVLQITTGGMPVAYRKPVSISLPPPLLREVERLAKRQHQTTSELVRAALPRYIDQEKAWRETLAYGRMRAKQQGIRTEEDIYRIMDEIRHGRPSSCYAAAGRR